MILRTLLYQITLMLVQRCRSEFDHYSYQGPNLINKIEDAVYHPKRYQNSYETFNPQLNFRRHKESSSCHSGSTEECVCSCSECNNPKACCRDFCKKCPAPGDNTDSNINQPSYPTQSQSNVVVIPYPVPVLIFPIKTIKSVKSTKNNTEANDKEIMSPNNKTLTNSSETTSMPTTSSDTESSTNTQINSKEIETNTEETQSPSQEIEMNTEETQSPSQEIETTTDQTETPSQEIEINTEQTQSLSQEIEMNTEETQSPSQEIETTTDRTETPSQEIEKKLEEPEILYEEIESTTDESQTPSEIPEELLLPDTDPKPKGETRKLNSEAFWKTRLRLPYHIPSWIRKFI